METISSSKLRRSMRKRGNVSSVSKSGCANVKRERNGTDSVNESCLENVSEKESGSNSKNCSEEQNGQIISDLCDYQNTVISENIQNQVLSLDGLLSAELPTDKPQASDSSVSFSSNHTPSESSQPETLSQDILPDSQRSSTSTDSGERLQGVDNREVTREWNSQDLADTARRLAIRRKQVKRLVMTVIRKRQMQDESLEEFKKRLRRM